MTTESLFSVRTLYLNWLSDNAWSIDQIKKNRKTLAWIYDHDYCSTSLVKRAPIAVRENYWGLVAQLVEQRPFKPFVQGSSPCQPTIFGGIPSTLSWVGRYLGSTPKFEDYPLLFMFQFLHRHCAMSGHG